jgi:hypothetical protein
MPTTPKCTIHIVRDPSNEREDDVIQMYDDPDFEEMVRITFRSERTQRREFFLDISRAVAYVSTILKTLTHDVVPFERVQVTTMIHPAVFYHVSDLSDCTIRHLIEDTVESALRRPVS